VLPWPGIRVNPASVNSFRRILVVSNSPFRAPLRARSDKQSLDTTNLSRRTSTQGQQAAVDTGKVDKKAQDSHFPIRPSTLIPNLQPRNLLLLLFPIPNFRSFLTDRPFLLRQFLLGLLNFPLYSIDFSSMSLWCGLIMWSLSV
jgi:hypothetical protein